MNYSISYRPEIDGLRAIAILSVVLYHAGIGPASGFVGVDIFFVISGYLITALLRKELFTTGKINLFNFYARRFRRLFPALVLVVISTFLLSLFLLSPYGEILNVAQSSTASLLFISNIFFEITTGGYFDGATDKIPLLHLWSLAVEEQFYLVWPIVIILIYRFRQEAILPVLIVLAACSFVYSEILVNTDPDAAFYRMPARFWELAIGCLIALRPSGRIEDGRKQALTGLVIIVFATVIPISHFPGIGALPAVTGSALLIHAIHGTSALGITGRLLRNKVMVFFGLISYSLYLWHWPLLAFEHATRIGPTPISVSISLCIVSIGIAWVSYRFVELPFRAPQPNLSSRRIVFSGITASIALSLGLMNFGDLVNKEPLATDLASVTSRDMPDNRFACNYRGDESIDELPKPACNRDSKGAAKVAIWGDSMAYAWQPFAWELGKATGKAVTSFSRDACPPILDYSNGKYSLQNKLCKNFNSLVSNKVKGLDTIILSSSWTPIKQESNNSNLFDDFEVKLRHTINTIYPYVSEIILLGPTPSLRDTVPRCIRSGTEESCSINRTEFDDSTLTQRKIFESISEEYRKVMYIEPANFFCTSSVCPAVKDGYGLYWDDFHVSSTAATKFAIWYLSQKHTSN